MIQEPWQHMVIDDYYRQDLYEDMMVELKEFIKEKRSQGRIVKNKTLFRNITEDHNLPATKKCLNNRLLSKDVLQNFDNVRHHTTYEVMSEVNVCLDDLSYPIHDEAKNKILSAVTYLMPEVSRGTLLFDKDKNFVKEVQWKPNRTLIFAPIDDVTWHSYECIPKSYRITINSFLLRPNVY